MPRRITSSKKETIVLKLSGSLFFSKEFDLVTTTLRRVLNRKKNTHLVIVTGGGKTAREYIAIASKLGVDQSSLDELGIEASRINALLLIKALGNLAVDFVPTTLGDLVESIEMPLRGKRAVVLGGLHPGQSTNAIGALISEKLGAKLFLNATDVDGVYTKDPRKFKDAKKLSKVTTKQLAKILNTESMRAGGYDLMDPVALKLIERSKVKTRIIKCSASTITAILLEGKKIGTTLSFS